MKCFFNLNFSYFFVNGIDIYSLLLAKDDGINICSSDEQPLKT